MKPLFGYLFLAIGIILIIIGVVMVNYLGKLN